MARKKSKLINNQKEERNYKSERNTETIKQTGRRVVWYDRVGGTCIVPLVLGRPATLCVPGMRGISINPRIKRDSESGSAPRRTASLYARRGAHPLAMKPTSAPPGAYPVHVTRPLVLILHGHFVGDPSPTPPSTIRSDVNLSSRRRRFYRKRI